MARLPGTAPHGPLPLIQRFPSALLPLLSIKSSDTPAELLQQVQPGLELLPFYLADRLETQVGLLAGVTTAGAEITQTVPAGEYWYIWNLAATAQAITVGSNVQLSVGYRSPANLGPAIAAMQAPVVSIAGQTISLPGIPPAGLLLGPGCVIFASTLVAPTQLDLRVWVVAARLRPN